MNLRHAENYTIGLDLGTGSVGWAVVDEDNHLYHIKGQPSWGSRLFDSADTAAATRLKRGQRRRYARRRQRLDKLQEIFAAAMADVDSEFFIRLRQSRLLKEDKSSEIKDFRWPLFNDDNYPESKYYEDYRTIYHLRRHLMQSDAQEDLRLVYLALHNIVKYRGNFLHEDEGETLSAANANAAQSAHLLVDTLEEYFVTVLDAEWSDSVDVDGVQRALETLGMRRGDRIDLLLKSLKVSDADATKRCKEVAKACVGQKVEFATLFDGIEKSADTKFRFSDEDKPETFVETLCPDDAQPLFGALQGAYSAYVLSSILQGKQSISDAMVASYEQHQTDLKILKQLFKRYLSKKEYRTFFRGTLDDRGAYDINQLVPNTYTAYIVGEKKSNKGNANGSAHEGLVKHIREICDSHPEIKQDGLYAQIADRLDSEDGNSFLTKQKTRANGAIPYQLHLEEMKQIIDRQGKYYPFLMEHKELLCKLVSSRIPYYVGPLNFGRDPEDSYPNNSVDSSRKYSWAQRKPGTDGQHAYPWNYQEVVDIDRAADDFIRRMTGTCTYLLGKPVLPKHSLLYEEYCVLNELNTAHWGEKGKKHHRFDYDDKEKIFEQLFKRGKHASVSYKSVQEWLKLNSTGALNPEVAGGQGEIAFESKLSTYRDFCKIFNVSNLEDASLSTDEIEEIVLWNTVFEDRAIFRKRLNEKYGPAGDGRLSTEQIKRIVAKRYTGWGRLSKELLVGIRVPANVASGSVTVMDVLRNGNPFNHLSQMGLMEVLSDHDLCFQDKIDSINKEYLKDNNETLSPDALQGSPANRRAVTQAMRIIDEIVHITGKKAPARICIEVTRDDDFKKKGKRTVSRYQDLKSNLGGAHSEAQLLAELDEYKDKLDSDRLMLYFSQQGKCMYSGTSLDINSLQDYQIDHILPQSQIKDDSLNNRVLVISSRNQDKLDSFPLDEAIVSKRYAWWKALLEANLISRKKFERLTTRDKSYLELQTSRFINRQLVETSQVAKFVRQICEQKYPTASVISVRANASHGVREILNLVKSRDLNNFHHAHDAFLACVVADFVNKCYPTWLDSRQLNYIQQSINKTLGKVSQASTLGRSGFIAGSLTRIRHIDDVTGEIIWDNEEISDYIRKAFQYKSCFISKMTTEQTGAFWDETVYSPRDARNGKSLVTPLKCSQKRENYEGYLDPQKYGGVSSVKQAYWIIFAAKDKKNQWKYFFEGVPIHRVNQINKSAASRLAYVNQLAEAAGCSNAVILRPKVPLRQKFELDGTPYYLFGSGEIRPARELLGESSLVEQLFNNPDILSDADIQNLYSWMCVITPFISPKLQKVLNLQDHTDDFATLGRPAQTTLLKGLVQKLNQTAQTIDTSAIGGSKYAGLLAINVASSLPSITWIDQSVTGIFERRTTFKDLTRGL